MSPKSLLLIISFFQYDQKDNFLIAADRLDETRQSFELRKKTLIKVMKIH